MKTIGLIGGMSWESTAIYYRLLNEMARERRGGLHSAQLLLWSFDFAEIEALQATGDWDAASRSLVEAARRLERAGADGLIICTNTMHKLAAEVESAVDLPLLHIGDATAEAMLKADVKEPLLLATRYTMEQDFYRGRMSERGIHARVPDAAGRTVVHDVIYDELCRGVVDPGSRRAWLDIVARAIDAGADGVIFGCTEVGMLISADDVSVPVFDSTVLHARMAMEFALGAGRSHRTGPLSALHRASASPPTS